MSIKCAHCGFRHMKIETVRMCALEAKQKDQKPVSSFPGVPDGRYVLLENQEGAYTLFRVKRPKYGKHAGKTFLTAFNIKSDDEYLVKDSVERRLILETIAKDVPNALAAYGYLTSYCGRCGITLSDIREDEWPAAALERGFHLSCAPLSYVEQ